MLRSPRGASARGPRFKEPDWSQPSSVHKRLLGSQGPYCCHCTWSNLLLILPSRELHVELRQEGAHQEAGSS
ncbi:hypothetical protein CapIbe_011727 [Capra ibex]